MELTTERRKSMKCLSKFGLMSTRILINKVNTLIKIKDDINNDANTIKENIKQELFNLVKLGRKMLLMK